MNLGLSLVMLMFQSAFSIWKNKISHVQAPGSSCKPGSWMLFSSIHLAKWLSCLKGARDQLLCRFKWTLIHLQSNKEKSNAVKRDFGAAGSGAQVVISSILLTSIDRKRQIPQVHGALRLVSVDKFWVCSPWRWTAVRMNLTRGGRALAQEPLALWHSPEWAWKGRGAKPGWPVMNNGMECQNLRKGKLERSLNMSHEVLAQCATPELFPH